MTDKYGMLNYKYLPEFLDVEPRHQVIERIKNYLIAIAQKHKNEQIVVVTHGAAMSLLLVSLGYNLEELPPLTNESIVTVLWQNDQEDDFIFQSIEYVS